MSDTADPGTITPGSGRLKAERGPLVDPPRHPLALSDLSEVPAAAERLREEGPLVADLFCGCGGLSLGADAAGWVPVVGIDHDAAALKTWASLFPGLALDIDLGRPENVELIGRCLADIRVDAVIGGPPCQPFSRAGRSKIRHLVGTGIRDEVDHRRELWRSFLRIVEISGPDLVMMENVPELALGDDSILLRTITDQLEGMGYGVEARLVSTKDHGVPQFRQRIIIVGLSDGRRYEWPETTTESPTVRMAIEDLSRIEVTPGWNRLGGPDGFDRYTPPVEWDNELLEWLRSGLRGEDRRRVYDHVTRAVREDDWKIFDSMGPGTKYSEIDERLKRYRDDIFDDKYKRLDWDQPSRSITAHLAKDGYWYIHPSQNRTLTIREAARIQTFPDRVRFAGTPSASLRQIGNAVPPYAAFQLLKSASECLRHEVGAAPRTTELAEHLAGWQQRRSPHSRPWFEIGIANAWQVIQAELLLGRGSKRDQLLAWGRTQPGVIRQLDTPCRSLDAEQRLRTLFGPEQQQQVARVMSAARWYDEQLFGAPESGADIAANPEVGTGLASLVALISCPEERPLVVTTATLRVAARFWGSDVDGVNRNSDGRLAVARLVGGSVDTDPIITRRAQLALVEIGDDLCLARSRSCSECPLSASCAGAEFPEGSLLG